MKLREIAHARAGDKGDISSVSVIAYDPGDFAWLCEQVTVERVKQHFGGLVRGAVERYELPGLGALNFVLHGALGGGVTRSLALDAHGKSLSSCLLELEVDDMQRAVGRDSLPPAPSHKGRGLTWLATHAFIQARRPARAGDRRRTRHRPCRRRRSG